MNIRFLEKEDARQIGNIYEKFFSNMEFPNFFNKFHCVYVVTDNNSEIVAVGGLKPITEAIVLTNKFASIRMRREALLQIYEALNYSAEKLKYEQIHAFSYDDIYTDHLINRMKFKHLDQSKVLVLDVKNGQKETT